MNCSFLKKGSPLELDKRVVVVRLSSSRGEPCLIRFVPAWNWSKKQHFRHSSSLDTLVENSQCRLAPATSERTDKMTSTSTIGETRIHVPRKTAQRLGVHSLRECLHLIVQTRKVFLLSPIVSSSTMLPSAVVITAMARKDITPPASSTCGSSHLSLSPSSPSGGPEASYLGSAPLLSSVSFFSAYRCWPLFSRVSGMVIYGWFEAQNCEIEF